MMDAIVFKSLFMLEVKTLPPVECDGLSMMDFFRSALLKRADCKLY